MSFPLAPFNPSLVRLAPGCERDRKLYLYRPFQSQLGSIGAQSGSRYPQASVDFQSQLGSIGALARACAVPILLLLSIPAWFDWRPAFLPGLRWEP